MCVCWWVGGGVGVDVGGAGRVGGTRSSTGRSQRPRLTTSPYHHHHTHTPQAAYINLELCAEEKEKGNQAFKEQR